jgi:HAD superfamily hydrolase (TIGR01509 family)
MPLKGIIFDFDGVLVDSENYWEGEEQIFYRRVIPGWKNVDHNLIVGMRMVDTYKLLKEKFTIMISFEEFLEEYDAIASRVYAQCAPMPGLSQCIKELHDAGFVLAIASSARRKWLDLILEKFSLKPAFPVIVGAEDIADKDGKPSPTIFLLAAERMGLRPEACVAVEDARNGVTAAKNAGMSCIALRTNANQGQDLSRADREIRGFAEFTTALVASL